MAAVMLFLQQTTGKTERHTHFCMPLEPVFTRDCGGRVHFTDEPTGNLDTARRNDILRLFHYLNREEGMTIVLVTHDSFVARSARRNIQMRDGKIGKDMVRTDEE